MEKFIERKSDEVNFDIFTIVKSVTNELSVSFVVEVDESKTRFDNITLEKLVKNTEFPSIISNSSITTQVFVHPDKLYTLAKDFVNQYENKLTETSSKTRKAIFLCNNKAIAHQFYKNVIDYLGTRRSRFPTYESSTSNLILIPTSSSISIRTPISRRVSPKATDFPMSGMFVIYLIAIKQGSFNL